MNKLLMVEQYRKLGWSVIPLKPKNKEPLIPWAEFQKRVATDKEIKEWFDGTDNNVGIVTGSISNLGIVDADGETGLKTARELSLSTPFSVLTGNGKQLYFSFSGNHNTCKTLAGIDTRGEGGYVVAPPSIHPNGMPYRWVNGIVPNIVQLPEWPKDQLEGKQESLKVVVQPLKAQSILDLLITGCKTGVNGGRHPTLIKLATYLIPRHSYEITKHLLMEWNKLNIPPYPESEIDKQIQDLSKRYQNGTYTSTFKVPTAREPLDIQSAQEGMAQCLQNISTSTLQVIELPIGFSTIDSVTNGLKRGGVYVVGARPGTGKTSLCVQIVATLCSLPLPKKVLYFSTELTSKELCEKLATEVGGIDAFLLSSKNLDALTLQELQVVSSIISNYPLHIVNLFKPDEQSVREAVEQIQPDVIVFDHIQHIASGDRTYQDLDKFTKMLKEIAIQKNCAVIVASQLNRGNVAEGRIPELHDLKGCGTLEEEASVVILMHDTQKKGNRPILFRVAKNRGGKTGDTTLLFECNYTRFQDMGVAVA